MALVGGSATRADIPHEPGQWMTLRDLGARALRRAREASASEGRRVAREFGAEVYDMLQHRPGNPNAIPDALGFYDRDVLLEEGVEAWSYPLPVNADSLGRLDLKTEIWACRAILDRSGVAFAWGAERPEGQPAPDPTPSSSASTSP